MSVSVQFLLIAICLITTHQQHAVKGHSSKQNPKEFYTTKSYSKYEKYDSNGNNNYGDNSNGPNSGSNDNSNYGPNGNYGNYGNNGYDNSDTNDYKKYENNGNSDTTNFAYSSGSNSGNNVDSNGDEHLQTWCLSLNQIKIEVDWNVKYPFAVFAAFTNGGSSSSRSASIPISSGTNGQQTIVANLKDINPQVGCWTQNTVPIVGALQGIPAVDELFFTFTVFNNGKIALKAESQLNVTEVQDIINKEVKLFTLPYQYPNAVVTAYLDFKQLGADGSEYANQNKQQNKENRKEDKEDEKENKEQEKEDEKEKEKEEQQNGDSTEKILMRSESESESNSDGSSFMMTAASIASGIGITVLFCVMVWALRQYRRKEYNKIPSRKISLRTQTPAATGNQKRKIMKPNITFSPISRLQFV